MSPSWFASPFALPGARAHALSVTSPNCLPRSGSSSKIELSNPTKVLFPDNHIGKAQLFEYYFNIAPTILAHVKGTPAFPCALSGRYWRRILLSKESVRTPDWIEHVLLGNEPIDYLLATEAASLVWMANLACIELQQMPSRAPHFDRPDYVVYDLDPPENLKFSYVTELALEFKEHLEKSGYHPFVKTTGRMGLHVLTPIESKYGFSRVFEAAKGCRPAVRQFPMLRL